MTTRASPPIGKAGGSGVAPVGADEEVRRGGQHLRGRRLGAEPHVDAEPVELALELEDEVEQLLARRPGGCLPQLSAEHVLALEEDDRVARLGGDPRGLEPGRAAAGDDDAPRSGSSSASGAHSASRPSRGLIVQVTPPAYRRQSCTIPMHGRIRSASPARAFATHSGSASSPRPTATKSACPASSARSASPGSRIRPATMTGTSTTCFTAAGEPEREALVPARVLDVAAALPRRDREVVDGRRLLQRVRRSRACRRASARPACARRR